MRSSRIRVLLLYAQYSNKLSYFDDWKDAFVNAPQFDTIAFNICEKRNFAPIKKSLSDYDLIILLHSAVGDTLEYMNSYRQLLKSRRGAILTFVGNEVNIPGALIRDKIAFIKDLQIEFIGTQLPLEAGRWLYAECLDAEVIPLPHALNPAAFHSTIDQKDRKIDFGVRTYKYSPYLGDNDRNDLIEFLVDHQAKYSLQLDINYNQRFNRTDWANFLNTCKATISTEAGSFFLERDDRTMLAILDYCRQKFSDTPGGVRLVNQDSVLYKLRNLAPEGLKRRFKRAVGVVNETEISYLASHAEIYDKFFKHYGAHATYTKAISSRHFDAIGTKTCQLMFPGRFNDILVADQHYIALCRDFSNVDECIRKMRDLTFRNSMVDNAYEYITSKHTYQHRVAEVARIISEAV